MTSYGAVPDSDEEGDAPRYVNFGATAGSKGCAKWFWHYLQGGDLNVDEKAALRTRLHEIQNVEYFCIHAESVRQIAYTFFWLMIITAGIFTSLWVDPDLITNSDLKAMYGYNNVCVLFDYSPSREYTAMVYPLFEYSFFFYVMLDYIHLRLVCKNTPQEYVLRMANYTLPVKLCLIAWFRMIFVYNIQQPDVQYGVRGVIGHTLAFFGLQLALILIAFENIVFIFATGIYYPRLGRKWTLILARAYLIIFIILSGFQMWFAFGLFWGYKTLDVQGDNPNPTHQFIIWLDDRLWMIFVGLMPFWFAHIGRKNQSHIRVTVQLNSEAWGDDTVIRTSTVQRSQRNTGVVA